MDCYDNIYIPDELKDTKATKVVKEFWKFCLNVQDTLQTISGESINGLFNKFSCMLIPFGDLLAVLL